LSLTGKVFYSQTPESCLKDLGEIKGSFSKGAGAKHLRILKGDVILNEVKNRRNERIGLIQQFFEQSSQNDKLAYPRSVGERVPKAGEGLREKEILRPSAEILSEHLTPNAQNDKRVNVISEQSYSSEARVSSRLEKETEINKKLDSRTQGFESFAVIHFILFHKITVYYASRYFEFHSLGSFTLPKICSLAINGTAPPPMSLTSQCHFCVVSHCRSCLCSF